MADLILVVAELDGGTPKKITYELLNAARQVAPDLDAEIGVVVLGDGLDADALAGELGSRGADVLYIADDSALGDYNVEPYAAALQQIISDAEPTALFFGMTAIGRELAPRVAGKVKAGLASDIVGLEVADGELLITRPMYSGQVLAQVKVKGMVLATLRANTWAAAAADAGKEADVEEVDVDDLPESRVEVLSVEESGGDRPALGDASVVVSGGRGLGNAENFAIVESLADLMKGAVGTTRAVVDAGWRPYEEQVGQTGKTISPKLYIALGISGALQHLSGMRTSKTIVAINKDKDAPIFKLADYGIVGDVNVVVPELEKAIKEL
jgi:electron transfer flavoprotein alpha subunit